MESVFFIVGPHGVGKTYLVNEIKKNADILHIDLGPLIRKSHQVFKPNISLEEWVKEGEEKYGKNFTDIILCKHIERLIKGNEDKTKIITGSRSIGGIQFITNRFLIEKPNIIYMDAPFEQLKENYQNRENINISNEEFENILEKERKMGLEKLKEYAKKYYTYVQNDNTRFFIEKMKNTMINYKEEREV